jgi:rhodanese-related sulfurtransferase
MRRLNYIISIITFLTLFSCQANDTVSQDQAVTQEQTKSAVSLNDAEWSALLLGKPGVIIDVRTPGEFEQGYIEGAELIDVTSSSFMSKIQELSLNKEEPIYIYCRSGNRSKKAMSMLSSEGFTEIYELDHGIIGWQKAGYPINQP